MDLGTVEEWRAVRSCWIKKVLSNCHGNNISLGSGMQAWLKCARMCGNTYYCELLVGICMWLLKSAC